MFGAVFAVAQARPGRAFTCPGLNRIDVVWVSTPTSMTVIYESIKEPDPHRERDGFGNHILPRSVRGCSCLTPALPSAVVRDFHHMITVAPVSEVLHWINSKEVRTRNIIFAVISWIAGPVLLAIAMLCDSLLICITGILAIFEILYLFAIHRVATPSSLAVMAAHRHYLMTKNKKHVTDCGPRVESHCCCRTNLDVAQYVKDHEAYLFDEHGNCEDFKHLLVPAVNPYVLAAYFIASVLILHLEVRNVLSGLHENNLGEASATAQFWILAVQFGLNSIAQTILMARADLNDLKKIKALQSTGALLDSNGNEVSDSSSVRKVGNDIHFDRTCSGGALSTAIRTLVGVLLSGFFLLMLVVLRDYRAQTPTAAKNTAGLILGFVTIANVALLDILRYLDNKKGILIDDPLYDLSIVVGVPMATIMVTSVVDWTVKGLRIDLGSSTNEIYSRSSKSSLHRLDTRVHVPSTVHPSHHQADEVAVTAI